MSAPFLRILNRMGLVFMLVFALLFAGILGRLGAGKSGPDKANIASAQRVLETERAYLLVRATELDAREKRLSTREVGLDQREKRLLNLQAISGSERADLDELDRLVTETIKIVEARKIR